jgi:signal transduction histidine kinase
MSGLARWRRRTRAEVAAGAFVLVGLVVFVGLVYAVVVLGAGALTGDLTSPSVALSVLATAVVAIAFDPVQTRLEELASRVVHPDSPAPYDVLRRFFATVTGSYRAEELPARMARVLAEGTGVAWSQVWLVVGDRPSLAATWPPGATREPGPDAPDPRDGVVPGRRTLAVRQGDELLGVLVVQERDQVPLTSVEERLFAGLAAQAGLVLRGARLRAELEHRAVELAATTRELRGSLERLVDVQDEKRRLLERDIHDGAQQHLVALAVNLRLAETLAADSPDRSARILASQHQAVAEAVTVLTRLSRGIYPSGLAEEGLAAALTAATSSSTVPVHVSAVGLDRFAANLEAAAYFCTLEAVQNAAKHADATSIRVVLDGDARTLTLSVEDDGRGFDPASTPEGAGLSNIRDRVESLDGSVSTDSAPGRGTRVHAVLPTVRR